MKKKLIVATVLILLLSLSLTMLVGCDEIFKKNDERDATQVVATVNYNGQSTNIYKFELMASFNQYAYAYNSYYGMTYEQAADYILQSLAQQKLLVMYAMEKVPTLGVSLGKFETAPTTLQEMLSKSEQNKAVENANDSLYSALSSLIKDSIAEDNYNSGSSTTVTDDDDDEDEEITEPVYIRYESNGGSSVERQRVQKGATVKEPTEPTKDGYTFYGWYENKDDAKEDAVGGTAWHFRDKVLKEDKTGYEDKGTPATESKTLYAKWVKFVDPRTEKPEVEEEEDYDPDDEMVEISPKFFTDEYKATLFDKVAEEDYVETIDVEPDKFETTLQGYIDDALATLEKNLKNNLYKSSKEECYEYYLKTQMETLLVTKLERLLGEDVTVDDAEIEKEFNRVVAENKETFLGSNASYSSALTSMLDGTYYHNSTEDSYGFVINILLKLDEEKVNELTTYLNNHPGMTAAATIMRNRMLSEMTIKVSNPEYDSTAVVKDAKGDEIELRDPMTDPANPYNNKGGKVEDKTYQKEGGNNYEKLISFEKVDGKYTIVYGASEHPAMAYLLEEVPAFDVDGKTGIIHQIQNSLAQVKAATDLTSTQKTYWLREVATAWLYLVGDDSGAVSTDSNNGGLGYLVSPEGETSGYLEAFTDYARALIKAGTGSFRVGEENEKSYLGAETDGTLNGDGVVYVAADSFIETGNTGNAYAGIFVLVNSYTVWDPSFYDEYADGEKLEGNTLPLDYLLTFAQDKDDMKTVYDLIKDALLAAKQKNVYNLDVNTVGNENMDGIVYYKKAYKSLWQDLD